MPLFLVLFVFLFTTFPSSKAPAQIVNNPTKISIERHEEILQTYKREIERLSKSVKKFQDAEFERTGKLADGAFLRTGWVSLNVEGCGIYSQDEWACKKPIEDSSLTWGTGCIKNTPLCNSGKSTSTKTVYSTQNMKRCIKQWIRWECGENPVTREHELDNIQMNRYKEWSTIIEKRVNTFLQ